MSQNKQTRREQTRREIAGKDWKLGLEVVHARAAGIDIGAEEHYVAVPPHLDTAGRPVRSFQAFTADLNRLADWLQQCGVETVAMQSTGVYWIALYDVLEQRGINVFLVECATHEEPARTQERRTGMSVAAAVARLWAAEELVPAGRGDPDHAELLAATAGARGRSGDLHPADAESADPDEPAVDRCAERY